MVICKLPPNVNSTSLTAVSLATKPCTKTLPWQTNVVDLVDLIRRRKKQQWTGSSSVRREVPNTDPRHRPDDVVDFTVCVTSPIHGNGIDASTRLVEFIEVHRLFGARRFIYYVGSSEGGDDYDDLKLCLTKYAETGSVEIVPWKNARRSGNAHDGGAFETTTTNDCIYRATYRTKYLVVVGSVDEFVVPMKSNSWQEMLDRIRRERRSTAFNSIAVYNFKNVAVALRSVDDVNSAPSSKIASEKRQNLRTLVKTATYFIDTKVASPVVARPDRLITWNVDSALESNFAGDVDYDVDESDGLRFCYGDVNVTTSASGRLRPSAIPNRRMDVFAGRIIAGVNAGIQICRKTPFQFLQKLFMV